MSWKSKMPEMWGRCGGDAGKIYGDVLEEQDAEGGASEAGGELPLLRQQLDHEGRGGEREAAAQDDGRRPRGAERGGDGAEDQRGERELCAPEPKGVAPHRL